MTLSADSERRAIRRGWQPRDRQAFADRDLLRASTVPSRRPMPPAVAEWLDEVAEAEVEQLDPPAYLDVELIVPDDALDHLDRLAADPHLIDALASATGVEASRLTLSITTSTT